jgi:hypothetical protein
MADPSPFTPGASISLAASATTANTALPTGTGTKFLLQNDGTVTVFFAVDSSSVVATAASTPLLAGMAKVFTLDPNATNIAAITGTGTTTLRVTRGEGI